MAGTYWLTILPETSQLRPRIKAALAGLDADITVTPTVNKARAGRDGREFGGRFSRSFDAKPNVDQSGAGAEGRAYGRKFSREFNVTPNVDDSDAESSGRRFGDRFERGASPGVLKLAAAFGGALLGFKVAAGPVAQLLKRSEAIGYALSFAALAARGLSSWILLTATGLKAFAAAGLGKFATALGLSATAAKRLGREISRVTSAALVAMAAFKTLMAMNTFAKWAGLAVIGGVALLGVTSALSSVLWGALIPALTATGAAIGIAAGAMVGLLGPAIAAAKIGFSGLAEGAKAFNEQFKEADEALYAEIGKRMAPMLIAARELKNAVQDTFSSALTPAFADFGRVLDGLRPKMTVLAGTLAGIGNRLAATLAGPEATAALDKMFAASNRFFQQLQNGAGISSLTNGLLNFAATAADTFAKLGGSIDKTLTKFGNWLSGISAEQMLAVFATLRQMFDNIASVVKPIMAFFKELAAISVPALAPGFQALGQAIAQAAPGMLEMARTIMPALSQVIANLSPIIPDLVRAFQPWATVLAAVAPSLASLVAQLAPLAPLVLAVTVAFKGFLAGMALYNTVSLAATGASKLWAGALKLVTGAQWALNLAMRANPIGLIITAVAAVGAALYAFFTKTETGRKLWAKIWANVKATALVVFEALKTAVQFVGEKLTWLWQNIAVPVFQGIGEVFKAWWGGAQIIWEAFKTALQFVGDKLMWLWQNIAVPVFDGIKTVVEAWWGGAKIIWDTLKTVVGEVGDKISALKDIFVRAFEGIRNIVTSVWDKIGPIFDRIKDAASTVGDFLSNPIGATAGVVVNTLGLDGKATGGMISGPGTGTSDSILARVSNGEYIVNAEQTAKFLPLLTAINAGSLPGFAGGGLALAQGKAAEGGLQGNSILLSRLLSRMFPQVGEIGGYRADNLPDHPSGRALDIMIPNPTSETGIALGNTITAFLMKNAGKLNVDYTIWRQTYRSASGASNVMEDRGSPTQNHMDHVHVTTKPGGPSGGFSAPTGLSLPGGGLGSSSMDGAGIGSSLGSALSADGTGLMTYRAATDAELTASNTRLDAATKGLREAEQRIDDKRTALESAQRKLAELQASGKAKESQLIDAQNRIDKLEREIGDAETDAATARDKLSRVEDEDNELRTKGKQVKAKDGKLTAGGGSGGGDASDLGRTFVSGVLESFGLDGSLFSNPLEWPSVKSVMAGVNFVGGLVAGGSEASGGFYAGAADSVGVGSLLSAVTPTLGPGEINPAVPAASLAAAAAVPAAHGGSGAAPGPVDNSININGNVGMNPSDVRTQLRAEQNARTRTTVVK